MDPEYSHVHEALLLTIPPAPEAGERLYPIIKVKKNEDSTKIFLALVKSVPFFEGDHGCMKGPH